MTSGARSVRRLVIAASVSLILLGTGVAMGESIAPAAAAPAVDPIVRSDESVQVTLEGARSYEDGIEIYGSSLAPVFDIEVLNPGLTIECHLNEGADGPCGARQVSGCPVYQCWRYVGALAGDGFAQMYVSEEFEHGLTRSFDYEFSAISQPPTTTISPPAADERYKSPRADEQPSFEINGASGVPDPVSPPISFQCTIAAGSKPPGPWRSCEIPRLRRLSVYTLRARAVDVFGRVDPTPARMVFSPTPCRARVLGKVRMLGQIVRHGLRLSVHCAQVTRFEVDLNLPGSIVSRYYLPSAALGYVHGRTTRLGQTRVVTLHPLRGLPRLLFRLRRLPLGLVTIPLGPWLYGAEQLRVITVRG